MGKLPTLAEAQAAHDAATAAWTAADAQRTEINKVVHAAGNALRLTRKALDAARERDARNRISRARRQAKALAAKYDIEIEIDQIDQWTRHIWVTGPEAIYPNDEGDPCEGDHIAFDWPDVLGRVQTYVEDIEKRRAA